MASDEYVSMCSCPVCDRSFQFDRMSTTAHLPHISTTQFADIATILSEVNGQREQRQGWSG